MTIRDGLLLSFVVAFTTHPAYAQGPGGPPPNYQQLVSQIADLQARVARLEGNITAADLAGSYSLLVLDTSMTGFRAGTPPHNATIETVGFRGTIVLNAGGTGSVTDVTCEGSRLTQGTWALTGIGCSGPSDPGVTWTYANGVLTITFLDDGDEIPLNVAAGGRLLVNGAAPFHSSDPSSDSILFILTRLR